MANVGFSTGCLYRSEMPFEKIIMLYQSSGADAIELSFATPEKLLEYQLPEEAIKCAKNFEYVTIHAPWKEVRYGSKNSDEIVEKLRFLCDKLPVDGIVLHPDTIDDFKRLNESGLPFLLENMDKRKNYGTRPEQFKELKRKYDFGFVLDTQHAYEHDPSMKLAEELVQVMGNRLKHMHVSGYAESEIHVPVHLAINRTEITKILKLGVNVPKILEGLVLENVEGPMKNELEYVRSYERK